MDTRNYDELHSALSDISTKLCTGQRLVQYKESGVPYNIETYERRLLHELLERSKHSSFNNFYYVKDYKTGKRVFSKLKQRGILELIERVRDGEYKDILENYFGESHSDDDYCAYCKNDALYKIETSVRRDMQPRVGFFSRIGKGLRGIFGRQPEYAFGRS